MTSNTTFIILYIPTMTTMFLFNCTICVFIC